MIKEKTVTLNQLWQEIKKSGSCLGWKTKEDFKNYLNEIMKKYPGRMMSFKFLQSPHDYLVYHLRFDQVGWRKKRNK